MTEIVHYAIPAFVVLLTLEVIISAVRHRELYATHDTFASLAMGLGNVFISLPIKIGVFALYVWLWEHRLFDLPGHWAVWVGLIIGEDFCYYWFHRAHHRVRLLWAAHVNHHSSERYNLATALRQSWTTPVTGILFWLPLPFIGFDPAMIFMAQSISLIYQFWIHTELIDRLGPLEWVFNTPSHHRVHHGADAKYLDRNHGGILIIWDRLFGTFQAEEERPKYGLVHNLETYNPVKIAFHEYRSIGSDVRKPLTWKERLAYVWGVPGWSHDGSRSTSDQLREQEAAKES